jgi:hypothetical protein
VKISLENLENALIDLSLQLPSGGATEDGEQYAFDDLFPILYVASKFGEINLLDALVAARDSVNCIYVLHHCTGDFDVTQILEYFLEIQDPGAKYGFTSLAPLSEIWRWKYSLL